MDLKRFEKNFKHEVEYWQESLDFVNFICITQDNTDENEERKTVTNKTPVVSTFLFKKIHFINKTDCQTW